MSFKLKIIKSNLRNETFTAGNVQTEQQFTAMILSNFSFGKLIMKTIMKKTNM